MNNKSAKTFECKICDFKCSKKSNYDKHTSTLKHKNLTNSNPSYNKNADKQNICNCGKIYKHSSTLSAHKKKCCNVNISYYD